MADGSLIVEIDPPLSERVSTAAAALGLSEAEFVRDLLQQQLLTSLAEQELGQIDPDASIDVAIAEDTIRKGDGIPLETFLQRMTNFGRP
jgi:hypothetical protein